MSLGVMKEDRPSLDPPRGVENQDLGLPKAYCETSMHAELIRTPEGVAEDPPVTQRTK